MGIVRAGRAPRAARNRNDPAAAALCPHTWDTEAALPGLIHLPSHRVCFPCNHSSDSCVRLPYRRFSSEHEPIVGSSLAFRSFKCLFHRRLPLPVSRCGPQKLKSRASCRRSHREEVSRFLPGVYENLRRDGQRLSTLHNRQGVERRKLFERLGLFESQNLLGSGGAPTPCAKHMLDQANQFVRWKWLQPENDLIFRVLGLGIRQTAQDQDGQLRHVQPNLPY